MDRLEILKKLNELLLKIESKTNKLSKDKESQVKLYDKWTKEVNDSVKTYKEEGKEPKTLKWDPLQIELFRIYKILVKK